MYFKFRTNLMPLDATPDAYAYPMFPYTMVQTTNGSTESSGVIVY